MPRKDNAKKNRSRNERAMENRKYDADSPIQSPTVNDIADFGNAAVESNPITNNWKNQYEALFGSSDYSDFVRKANQGSDGWYSTIANGLPFVKDFHNALLGRDSAKDYLENNGLSWKDMQGYNDVSLLGRSSSGVSGLANQGGTYLSNIGNDLGKLYSGQKQAVNLYG